MDFGVKSDSLNRNFPNGRDSFHKNASPKTSNFCGEPRLQPDLNENMGECIIFNYMDYKKHTRCESRSGSNYDADSLEYVFKELKFNVDRHLNLSKEKTLKALKEASLNVPKESKYFVCCILTHGNSSDELATEDGFLDLDQFLCEFYPSTCENLNGKPKIFIIQACRGGVPEKAVKKDLAIAKNELHPDFIIAYSTYPGKLSFRSQYGSFYIQELCSCLEHFSRDQDLLQILTVVNYRMSHFFECQKKEDPELDKARQMPNFTSTLKSQICFEKGIKPYDSDRRKILNKLRAKSRLDQSGEINPYLDLKSYSIRTPQNVQFFRILIEKGGPLELSEASSNLCVYIKEKKYQHGRVKCDLETPKIKEVLESFASKDYGTAIDCMICFIAMRSKKEYLCGIDGIKVTKQEVIEKFVQNQHSSLVGKPKIFIFLMCDVHMVSSDIINPSGSPDSLFTAQHADILDITISIKNREHLTEPMKEFGYQLKKYGSSEDLLTILTRLNSILIEKYKFQNGNHRSTFTFNSTLTKKASKKAFEKLLSATLNEIILHFTDSCFPEIYFHVYFCCPTKDY